MTERLYLQDAYLATFSANVVERVLLPDGRLAVVLDRTAFYPGTGGLPADRGWLNRTQVVEIELREDGEILHVLSQEVWQDQVQARIDWPRRLDVMQQHTAGHLLAYGLAQVCGAAPAGITVNESHAAFLDLGRGDVSPVQVERAEEIANEIALSDRAIRVASVDAAQASKIGFTALPGAPWPRQVISLEGAGVTACEGLHVARTGEAGLVKVINREAYGDRLRLWFVAGMRALAEFRRMTQSSDQISRALGMSAGDAAPVVTRLASDLSAARSDLNALQDKLSGFEAEALVARAETAGKARIVRRVYPEREHSVAGLRQLARLIAARPGCVALLGIAGSRAQLVFARSADVGHDMTMFMNVAAQMLGTVSAVGEGQGALAESAPVHADEARVEAAVAKAFKLLQAQR